MQTDTPLHADHRLLNKQDMVDIYNLLSPRLFRYAVRLLGDADRAEECVAETFSRFLKVTNQGLGPRENVQAYLYQIAHNWVTDFYRQNSSEVDIELAQASAAPDNPAAEASANMENSRVRKALLDLPEDQRQVIMLRYYEEWSHEETAAAVGKTVEATRALQYRALNGLRRMLVAVEE